MGSSKRERERERPLCGVDTVGCQSQDVDIIAIWVPLAGLAACVKTKKGEIGDFMREQRCGPVMKGITHASRAYLSNPRWMYFFNELN